ncbi:Protoporphyrinogen oxidase [Myriangium duriaei CBS 260.36]|uniref:Protoporphyrinogen oxidase n=1 Tax=Myriangium duriaei CBS 260.36 TaxID=1168546 RepID=A0A9P4J6P1_9PEZI|nr:Protoporphyrinogen oxidase [Myriangium duriaei CBS 260.36]
MPPISRAAPSLTLRTPIRNVQCLYRYNFTTSVHARNAPNNNDDPRDVAIVGGGITGLGCAYYASKRYPLAKITIYEKTSRFGGWLQSSRHRVPGDGGTVLFESGPRTLRPKGNGILTLSMVEDLQLTDDTIFISSRSVAATNRYIYYPDHLIRLPAPPAPRWASDLWHTISTEEAFQGVIWAALMEPFRSARSEDVNDESIGSFLSRRLGRSVVDRVVSAVFHGIYAGDVWELSARSLLRRAYQDERDWGSLLGGGIARWRGNQPSPPQTEVVDYLRNVAPLSKELQDSLTRINVFTFREGISQLTQSLITRLKDDPNVKFASNTGIKSMTPNQDDGIELEIDQKDGHDVKSVHHKRVIWTGAPQSLRDIAAAQGDRRDKLPVIPSETVMTVNLYYNTPNMHPPGFGYLIPLATPFEQNPENALGVVFDDSYSPDGRATSSGFNDPVQDQVRIRGTKMTVMLGGHYWKHWSSFPNEKEGLAMAKEVVKRHLSITEEPIVSAVNLQANCIPRYAVGHHDRITQTHDWLFTRFSGKVKVAGSWIDGVGVNDCLRSAWHAVNVFNDMSSTALNSVVTEANLVKKA